MQENKFLKSLINKSSLLLASTYKHLHTIHKELLEKIKHHFKENILRERMKRFELSTFSLARRCSTTELHPHNFFILSQRRDQ